MRFMKVLAVVVVCLLAFSGLAVAGHNNMGVADRHQIRFDNPVRVGDTLLPVGNYQVIHTMEGENHVMVFKRTDVRKGVEVRVKCQLVKLNERATDTKKVYVLNQAQERVLSTLVFEGEQAQHQF